MSDENGAAFAARIEELRPRICAFIRRTVDDRAAIEDIWAETRLRAWRARASFSGDAKLSTWVFSIVTNARTDWLKKRAKERGIPLSEAPEERMVKSPTTSWRRPEKEEVLRELKAELTDRERCVIDLRTQERLPFRDIAVALGLDSEGSARQIYTKAKVKLVDLARAQGL